MHSLVLEDHGQAGETSSYRRMKDGADCEEGILCKAERAIGMKVWDWYLCTGVGERE